MNEDTMRTAIYVNEPSTVTITANDPRDAEVQLCRYNQATRRAAIGTLALEPGIYLIVSRSELHVTIRSVGLQVVANDKDPWPFPKANVIALEPGATLETLREFFTVAKDASPDDPSPDDVSLHD
jgi:hypothetical protein